ncbi:hypothetical protein [Algibacter sp.]|uniref:hypothetical protein n=1 Tax=Algibacter sp. TaxID=1872428 RepID=UPI003C72F55C
MNKTIKLILLVAGVALLVYGLYLLVIPETSVDLGIIDIKAQDNENAYITIGLGLVTLLVGFLVGRKA